MSAAATGLGQGSLFGGDAWVQQAKAPVVVEASAGSGFATLVEPYGFTVSDAGSRWTVTLAAEEVGRRGKRERALVARCTCGWTMPSVAQYAPGSGFSTLFEHLRDHVLAAAAPVIRVEETKDEWSNVRLAAGRVHCAAPECWLVTKKSPGPPGQPVACQEHGGSLHSRVYHWERADPADVGYFSEGRMLRGPDGLFWHPWCAPLEGRRLFGFVREYEQEMPL